MTTRQIGHFFFEPKDYDHDNQATHAYKEEVKLGYNLKRKVVLFSLSAVCPALLLADPTMFGLFDAHTDLDRLVGTCPDMARAGRAGCSTDDPFFFVRDVTDRRSV